MDEYLQSIYKFGEEYFTKSIYTKAVILTTDQKYFIGKVSKKTLNKNQYNLIGGVLSKSELVVNSGKALFESIHKEIEEELRLSKQEIMKSTLLGGILSSKLKIGLIFLVELKLSTKDLGNKIKLDKSEIVNYKLLNQDHFSTFLKSENVNNKIIIDLLQP